MYIVVPVFDTPHPIANLKPEPQRDVANISYTELVIASTAFCAYFLFALRNSRVTVCFAKLKELVKIIPSLDPKSTDNAGKTVVDNGSCDAFLQNSGPVKSIGNIVLSITYTVCAIGEGIASVACKSSYIGPSEIVTEICLGVTEELLF